MVSPYLLRPMRSLEQAIADIERARRIWKGAQVEEVQSNFQQESSGEGDRKEEALLTSGFPLENRRPTGCGDADGLQTRCRCLADAVLPPFFDPLVAKPSRGK
jgi:hypothetical protein